MYKICPQKGGVVQPLRPLPTYAPDIGDRRSLQTLQNNALRLCLQYRLVDRVRIERLHSEAKIQSVEQRCIFQLLKLL